MEVVMSLERGAALEVINVVLMGLWLVLVTVGGCKARLPCALVPFNMLPLPFLLLQFVVPTGTLTQVQTDGAT